MSPVLSRDRFCREYSALRLRGLTRREALAVIFGSAFILTSAVYLQDGDVPNGEMPPNDGEGENENEGESGANTSGDSTDGETRDSDFGSRGERYERNESQRREEPRSEEDPAVAEFGDSSPAKDAGHSGGDVEGALSGNARANVDPAFSGRDPFSPPALQSDYRSTGPFTDLAAKSLVVPGVPTGEAGQSPVASPSTARPQDQATGSRNDKARQRIFEEAQKTIGSTSWAAKGGTTFCNNHVADTIRNANATLEKNQHGHNPQSKTWASKDPNAIKCWPTTNDPNAGDVAAAFNEKTGKGHVWFVSDQSIKGAKKGISAGTKDVGHYASTRTVDGKDYRIVTGRWRDPVDKDFGEVTYRTYSCPDLATPSMSRGKARQQD